MSHRNSSNGSHGNHGRAPRPQRHPHPVRFASMRGGTPADRSAGATHHRSNGNGSSGLGWSTANGICTVVPTVPGYPSAVVKVAAIDAGGFWQMVNRPCVFRVLPTEDMVPEEVDALVEAGLFLFLVRPGREDADARALGDKLRAQGGPIGGEPVGLGGGAGRTMMQIVAVLTDE